MPSSRTASTAATAMRPPSPLSPRFEASRYDSLQQRSQPLSPPAGKSQRRQYGNNLTLPGLPRFHPANYPSAHSSFANTPTSGPNSPVLQQRLANDPRHTIAYQREYNVRPTTSHEKPTSPRLQPLGSPGPVTPLELASADGYMALVKPSPRSIPVDPEHLSKRLSQGTRPSDNLIRTPSAPRSR